MDTLDWYYKAVEAGEAVWLEPYYNGKIDEKVIEQVRKINEEDELEDAEQETKELD